MAEATDRPQIPGPAPADAASEAKLDNLAGTSTDTYRPLSLLALAGFLLAGIYALLVVIGAAVALFGRFHWLMPTWTFLLPLAALVVCWAARARIRDSEGALGGEAFTTAGIRLAVFVGLPYAAYYGATFFALRGQAVDKADHFLDLLEQGRTEQAFALTLGLPEQDIGSDEQVRDMLESRFNSPKGAPGSSGGELTRFRQERFVRYLINDGEKARTILRGVSDWSYTKGGYRFVLKYHIATTLAEFDLNLETFGAESKIGESKGRQWRVIFAGGETGLVAESIKLTPHGSEVLEKKMQMAQQLASNWIEKVNRHQWPEAYLDTLKASERSRLLQAIRFMAAAPLAGSAPLGLCDAACYDFLAGKSNLDTVNLVRGLDTFWAGKQQRTDIKRRVEKTFQSGRAGRPIFDLSLERNMPLVRESGDRTTSLWDVNLRYHADSGEKVDYVVEAQLVVSSDESDADRAVSAWRIEAINITSGRTPPPTPARRPRGPR